MVGPRETVPNSSSLVSDLEMELFNFAALQQISSMQTVTSSRESSVIRVEQLRRRLENPPLKREIMALVRAQVQALDFGWFNEQWPCFCCSGPSFSPTRAPSPTASPRTSLGVTTPTVVADYRFQEESLGRHLKIRGESSSNGSESAGCRVDPATSTPNSNEMDMVRGGHLQSLAVLTASPGLWCRCSSIPSPLRKGTCA